MCVVWCGGGTDRVHPSLHGVLDARQQPCADAQLHRELLRVEPYAAGQRQPVRGVAQSRQQRLVRRR
jgi:hypothetical protein